MKYQYEGVDPQGITQRGSVEAASEHHALRHLQGKGITVIEISPEQDKGKRALFTPKLTRALLVQALHELTTLISSGVSISDSIEAMVGGGHHPDIDIAFRDISRSLQHGESFSAALAGTRLPLPDYLFHLVKAGEQTGELGLALGRALEKMQYDQRTANELRNSLTYPIVLVFAGISAVILMFAVVVPKFTGMLGNSKVELPWLADAVLTSGTWFNANWDLLLGGTLLLVILIAWSLRNPQLRQRGLNGVSRLPLLGPWLYESDVASWSYTLAAMLASRVDMLLALNLSSAAMRVPRRQQAMSEVLRLVRSGKSLSDSLDEAHLLGRSGVNLIRVGERTGRVAEMFASLAAMYEDNSKNRIKKLLALIEPVAILLIGSIIGVIILGIILAITSVNEMAI